VAADTDTDTDTAPRRDPRLVFAAIFVVLCLLLGGGYYAFLRADYTVLYANVKPADAAAIVAALDAKGISHKVRDGGTTILVPSDEADSGQLAVAGSDVPLKGAVGFELFNKSDMGLTDFAQKINYQRALQGELARTIMMMDGIENARVHLALPEHSLFRSRQETPRAAIEVIAREGQPLSADRVAGIQQLVASAVPDLPLDEVVVLDGDGRIVSATHPADDRAAGADTEQSAVQAYYSARAKTALANALPGVAFEVHALVLSMQPAVVTTSGDDDAAPAPVPTPAANAQTGARNFQLRVTVVTGVPLNAEDRQAARNAVAGAIALDEAHGDSLSFEVGATTGIMPSAPAASPSSAPTSIPPATPAAPATSAESWWLWVALAVLGACAALWLTLRSRGAALDAEERAAFVARLRQQIAQGDAHA